MKSGVVALTRRLKKLYVPIISDTLDEMGLTRNTLAPEIRPLVPRIRIAGQALTAKTEWYPEFTKIDIADWIRVMLKMLEASKPQDIFVVSTGGNIRAAAWGELMSNAAQFRGAEAAVLDGAVRDVPRILSMKKPFQVFAKGINPADSKGRLRYAEYNITVECGGVRVDPGDMIFGDHDGVVCIPRTDAVTVVERSEEKLAKEDSFRRAVRRGMGVSEAFAKYKTF